MHYATIPIHEPHRRHRPLTDRQRHILDVVYACTGDQGYPPTLAELAEFLGCTTSTAQGHVDRLIRKGSLLRDGEGRRTLKIVDAEYMEANGPIAAAFLTDAELHAELKRRGWIVGAKGIPTKAERKRRRKE